MDYTKIVIIGAGSHFTLGLFGDLFRVNDLWESELVLMDINEEKLNIMKRIVERSVKREKVSLRINATDNLDEALENADFVIITIRSGNLRTLKEIIEVPLRLGTVEIVGDTVGPSGILKGIVEMPAIINIAEKIRDLSPHALVMNFTNPMTPICEAIEKTAKIETVGLCHGVHHIRRLASEILRIPHAEKLDVEAAGINHFTWTVDMRYEGESVYADFLNALFLEKNEEAIVNHPYLIGRDLYKVLGVPPTLSDRHTSEFFHYLYDWINDPKYGPILKRISGFIDYENKTLRREIAEDEKERMQRLLRMVEGREEIKIVPSGEYAMDIISAVKNRRETRLLAANIPNNGALRDVSSERFVEVPIQVSEQGLVPVRTFQLPKAITSMLNLHLDKFQLLVDGILEKEKNLIVQAIALDPLTPSPEKAEKIFSTFIKHVSLQNYF
ncbi:hypothetical protein DRO22_02700 [Candidatus Bathyarchaeota archaeon]|nr:MAG: hypothetical protein DRO22_02700 [Candidatus Bathyarchaeota archaeon]